MSNIGTGCVLWTMIKAFVIDEYVIIIINKIIIRRITIFPINNPNKIQMKTINM
jgi:hypothetical protein